MIQLASEAEGAAAPASLVERMAAAFSPEGALAKSPDFEFRPQQQRMARVVGPALEAQKPVVIEAATGVGKSLAYLLPAVTFALENERKAVISTHTINLQEQLILKDLPIVQKIVGRDFRRSCSRAAATTSARSVWRRPSSRPSPFHLERERRAAAALGMVPGDDGRHAERIGFHAVAQGLVAGLQRSPRLHPAALRPERAASTRPCAGASRRRTCSC